MTPLDSFVRSSGVMILTELEILDLTRGGAGLARYQGAVVFIPGTMPGDVVSAKIVKKEKRFWRAQLMSVLRPSQERILPPCSVFNKCGGCSWQHIPYELQFKTKILGISQALSRAKVTLEKTESTHIEEFKAPEPYGYRNRIQVRGDQSGVGYFESGTQNLVVIDRCEIADERINQVLPQVKKEGLEHLLTLKSPEQQTPLFKAEIEVVTQDGESKVKVTYNRRHGANGFRQVNDAQNLKMKKWIAEQVCAENKSNDQDSAKTSYRGEKVLWDLFGGSGNLVEGLQQHFDRTVTVDLVIPEGQSTSQHQFIKSDIASWVKKQKHVKNPSKSAIFSIAVLDPAREGAGDCATDLAQVLLDLGVKKIIAVGCDADSWSRDLSNYQKKGWRVKKLAAFDFFPQTPHIEAIAVLEHFGL